MRLNSSRRLSSSKRPTPYGVQSSRLALSLPNGFQVQRSDNVSSVQAKLFSKRTSHQNRATRIWPKGIPPNVLIAASSGPAGFPIEAFGNDGH
jgi:hypothetical protein